MVDQVAQVARLAARLLLESGGETYRAEDTVYRIARHFGYDADIIAFPTGLTALLSCSPKWYFIPASGQWYSAMV